MTFSSHHHRDTDRSIMGEEQKKERENKEEVKEEKKDEEKKEEQPQEIVLKVDMHCEGCVRKVAKSLRRIEGVEEIKIDSKARMVMVKGKAADALKVCEVVQKKTRRKVEIISPLPKPPEEQKKEATEEQPPEENEEEPQKQPKPITVILKVRMHCEACAKVLQRRIKKIKGVESVETDLSNDQVIVKGTVDPTNLIENVNRRTRKQASIIPIEEKKEEENKPSEEKKEEQKPEEEKREETKEENGNTLDAKKLEYLAPKLFLEYAYAYPPELFSDENPNACSIV